MSRKHKLRFSKILAVVLSIISLTMVIFASAPPKSDTFSVNGATATISLNWSDNFTGSSSGSATATTSINRAQLCSVSVSISGRFLDANTNVASNYGNGNGGQNACSATIYPGVYGYWQNLYSSHRATYNGVSGDGYLTP